MISEEHSEILNDKGLLKAYVFYRYFLNFTDEESICYAYSDKKEDIEFDDYDIKQYLKFE